jgi:hypothetical protein
MGWSLLCFALITLSLTMVEFIDLQNLGSQNADWFDDMVRDPNKNWVALLLAGLGSGWLLARLSH